MNDLSNNKIRGLTPQWEKFPGFSILFDNPGDNYSVKNIQEGESVAIINCQLNSKEIVFYQRLNEILQTLIPTLPSNDYLFCPLPFSSYHVTAADLGNQGNLQACKKDSQTSFLKVFNNYPNELRSVNKLVGEKISFNLATKKDWNIRFRFKDLKNWKTVLVAGLEPADKLSEEFLNDLEEKRKQWNLSFQTLHGINNGIFTEYSPHVSLGYFANSHYSQVFETHRSNWEKKLKTILLDKMEKRRSGSKFLTLN